MKLCVACLAQTDLTPRVNSTPWVERTRAAHEDVSPTSEVRVKSNVARAAAPASVELASPQRKGSLRRALASIFDATDDDDVPTELYVPRRGLGLAAQRMS